MANQVAKALSEYQTSRAAFVESVRCLLSKEDGGRLKKALFDADVLGLLCRPLIQDVVPSIQIASLGTLSKVAQKSKANVSSSQLTKSTILDSVVASLAHQSRRVRLQANETLQSISGQSIDCANAVKNAGALVPLLLQLEDTDDELNRTAVETINILTNSSTELATEILGADTLSLLIGHLNTSTDVASMSLKASIVALLADACSTGIDLTSTIVDVGGMESVCRLATNRQATLLLTDSFRCLAHIASYSDKLAAMIAGYGVVPFVAKALTSPSSQVRRSASRLAYELSSKTADMAEQMAFDGGIICLVQSIEMEEAEHKLETIPAILALGHMAAFKERLALAIVEAKGIEILVLLLTSPLSSTETLAATTWAITQLAAHGPDISLAVANASALPALMNVYNTSRNVLSSTNNCGNGLNSNHSSNSNMSANINDDMNATLAPSSLACNINNTSPSTATSNSKLVSENGAAVKVLKSMKAQSSTETTSKTISDLDKIKVPSIEDVNSKSLIALETCIKMCPESAALEPLLMPSTSKEVLASIIKKLAELIPESVEAKRSFITSGGLMRLQQIAQQYYRYTAEGVKSTNVEEIDENGEINAIEDQITIMIEDMERINAIFPNEVVAYYNQN